MGNQEVVSKGNDPIYKVDEQPKPEVTFTEEELRAKLTEEQYNVTQNKSKTRTLKCCNDHKIAGTERAWSGKYVKVKEDGIFHCVVCDNELFKTDKKFESGSGWPSFTDVAKQGNVLRIVDESHGMVRTEVVCAKCGAHLGHVFDDGPADETGLRYCINSASLNFSSKDKPAESSSS